MIHARPLQKSEGPGKFSDLRDVDRCPSRRSPDRRIRACPDKHLRDILMALQHGHEQRGGAVRRLQVRIGPRIEQGGNQQLVTRLAAYISGVHPRLSRMLGSTPASRISLVPSISPSRTERNRSAAVRRPGEKPSSS